ncbi:hypothetical protein RIF23_18525 [Lipingzhangella sp. LS1_29]|uniref:Transposase n=1 Tax=Lipingzhangella rawalii TaxID=2055835 RepID=A0ABU2HBS7_9ACTN|nr:hypothetical protein [Lipingzhangella rawalii]MDS1272289.1 hypothetical protein [Lipingzhangella rawalii]
MDQQTVAEYRYRAVCEVLGGSTIGRLQRDGTSRQSLPAGSLRAQRKVHASGRISVANQYIKLGPRHRGTLVTVVVEDTHLRVLHGEEEIAVRPRKNPTPVTRLYVKGMGTQEKRQASPVDKPSRFS